MLLDEAAQGYPAARRIEIRSRGGTRRDRRSWRPELGEWRQRQFAALAEVEWSLVGPERAPLEAATSTLDDRIDVLGEQLERRSAWDERHPEAVIRVKRLTAELERLYNTLDRTRVAGERPVPRERPFSRHRPTPRLERGLDLGR